MNTKTKNINTFQNLSDDLASASQHVGAVLMLTAATLGLVEIAEHQNKMAITLQPAFAYETPNTSESNDNAQRREREETGPHYTSYGISQRTPGRTGKQ